MVLLGGEKTVQLRAKLKKRGVLTMQFLAKTKRLGVVRRAQVF